MQSQGRTGGVSQLNVDSDRHITRETLAVKKVLVSPAVSTVGSHSGMSLNLVIGGQW